MTPATAGPAIEVSVFLGCRVCACFFCCLLFWTPAATTGSATPDLSGRAVSARLRVLRRWHRLSEIVAGENLFGGVSIGQEVDEGPDLVGWWPASRKYGVDGCPGRFELRQHPVQPAIGELLFDQPGGQHGEPGSSQHGIHHRFLVVGSQSSPYPYADRLTLVHELPFIRALVVCEVQAVVSREISGMGLHGVSLEVVPRSHYNTLDETQAPHRVSLDPHNSYSNSDIESLLGKGLTAVSERQIVREAWIALQKLGHARRDMVSAKRHRSRNPQLSFRNLGVGLHR